ncbi:hypothetical protein Rsph17029_3737 [Rhodobacter sphaeroides ATCC 17029]|nr:hypothetical protein Rsph17029_3737 [Cereibacter sphaeroides ATCC 17029]
MTLAVMSCHPSVVNAGHMTDTMPVIAETFAKKTAPQASTKIYYDDSLPGFGLRVTKGGGKAFILNYHINRRERRFTIGNYPAWTAAAAREEARRLRRLIDQGSDPLEARNERRAAPDVADLWQEYARIGAQFTFTMAACNLARLPKLLAA